jgi:hypothetical protein
MYLNNNLCVPLWDSIYIDSMRICEMLRTFYGCDKTEKALLIKAELNITYVVFDALCGDNLY